MKEIKKLHKPKQTMTCLADFKKALPKSEISLQEKPKTCKETQFSHIIREQLSTKKKTEDI